MYGAGMGSDGTNVYVASGYFYMATPYYASDYTLSHLELDATLAANVRTSYFEAGHMMYVHEPSRLQQSKDVAEFVTRGSRG